MSTDEEKQVVARIIQQLRAKEDELRDTQAQANALAQDLGPIQQLLTGRRIFDAYVDQELAACPTKEQLVDTIQRLRQLTADGGRDQTIARPNPVAGSIPRLLSHGARLIRVLS